MYVRLDLLIISGDIVLTAAQVQLPTERGVATGAFLKRHNLCY